MPRVPVANETKNILEAHAIGNKADTAATEVNTSQSIMAYVKGILTDIGEVDLAAAAVGAMDDAAATTVATDETLVSYVKGLLNQIGALANTGGTASIGAILGDLANVTLATHMAKLGTIANAGGTASIGAILGDFANSALVTRLGILQNSGYGLNRNLANYLSVTADFTSATWNTVATHELFTVTGTVRVRLLAVSTGVGGGAGATIELGIATDTDAFIGTTTITDFTTGDLWYDTSPTTFTDTLANSVKDFIVSNGEDIGYEVKTAAGEGGGVIFHLWWEPISSGATVVAGAGGTL